MIRRVIRSFLSKDSPTAETELSPPCPDRRLYTVGDIHGSLNKVHRLLDMITEDSDGEAHDLVFLGDYVDRGPESEAVIDHLRALPHRADRGVICLYGNHEDMLLDYIDSGGASRWPEYGGMETMLSFGVTQVSGDSAEERRQAQAQALKAAIGDVRLAWIRELPRHYRSGNVICVHAYTNPRQTLEAQDEATLIWARPPKQQRPRVDGNWVVHGHTIVSSPTVAQGHIAVDTGAFRGAKLTAGVFDPDGSIRFLSA